MTHDAAFAFVDTLRDAAVRDLGWLLASPSLLTAAPGAPLAHPWSDAIERVAVEAWLAALDAAPQPLHRALDGVRPVRLGRYAECLLEYFLTHGPSLRLVAANLPLRSNGKTLGEVDFLVDAPDGQRLHWELAVKCYLCAPVAGAASLADFVGPNLADRLDRKRSRLLEHQLRLGDRHGFALLGYGAPSDAQMFVKGWLFYPYGVPLPPVSAEIADDHPRGFWLTHAQWAGMGGRATRRRGMERAAAARVARAAPARAGCRARSAGGYVRRAVRAHRAPGARADRRLSAA